MKSHTTILAFAFLPELAAAQGSVGQVFEAAATNGIKSGMKFIQHRWVVESDHLSYNSEVGICKGKINPATSKQVWAAESTNSLETAPHMASFVMVHASDQADFGVLTGRFVIEDAKGKNLQLVSHKRKVSEIVGGVHVSYSFEIGCDLFLTDDFKWFHGTSYTTMDMPDNNACIIVQQVTGIMI